MTTPPILYVEDEVSDVLLMQFACKRAGLALPLQVVPDGNLAVAYLAGQGPFADRQKYPLPCLLLLDLNLPGLSGFDVLEWLRQQATFRDLPVVVLSGSALESDREKAMRLGANDYVVKPDLASLASELQRVRDQWLAR
jgi:CheY-like chemotaxis protein